MLELVLLVEVDELVELVEVLVLLDVDVVVAAV